MNFKTTVNHSCFIYSNVPDVFVIADRFRNELFNEALYFLIFATTCIRQSLLCWKYSITVPL